jgi:hypothetical protein
LTPDQKSLKGGRGGGVVVFSLLDKTSDLSETDFWKIEKS